MDYRFNRSPRPCVLFFLSTRPIWATRPLTLGKSVDKKHISPFRDDRSAIEQTRFCRPQGDFGFLCNRNPAPKAFGAGLLSGRKDAKHGRAEARPSGQTGASPICLRAIGPTKGMSQRAPMNAFTIAIIMMTRRPRWTRAEVKTQSATENPSNHRKRPKDGWITSETMLNRNQAPPKMIDCIA